MESVYLSKYLGEEAQFRKKGSPESFCGCVSAIRSERVCIRMSVSPPVKIGEVFRFEIGEKPNVLMFNARLSHKVRNILVFEVFLPYKTSEIREEIRQLTPRFPVKLSSSRDVVEAFVLNVSPNGVGLETGQEFPESEMVKVEIHASVGTIRFKAVVAYCKPVENSPGRYRIGLRQTSIDNMSGYRWHHLLKNKADAVA